MTTQIDQAHFLSLTKAEFLYVCSALNGVGCCPGTLIVNVMANFEYETMEGVDEATLYHKLTLLPFGDIEILYQFVMLYWMTKTGTGLILSNV